MIPTSNPEMFDQYMSERKEALRNAFQSYTEYFADNYLNEAELMYASKYGQFPITDPEYKKYGAGVIHCMNTWKIMASDTHNIYYFEPDDENMSITLYINENVSSDFALVFEKGCSDENHTTCNIANLNLLLYDSNNNLVAESQTSNNNVEIIRLSDGYS